MFMAVQFLFFGLVLALIWLGVLTFFLLRMIKKYIVLTDGVNKKNLDSVLVSIVKSVQGTKKDLANLTERCATIEKSGEFHIQKIGLLRFNPFKDTGGDQSFIMTLVDAKDTGVIITALYSRTGMRWYAKKILKGNGVEHELSEEEKKALRLASNIDN